MVVCLRRQHSEEIRQLNSDLDIANECGQARNPRRFLWNTDANWVLRRNPLDYIRLMKTCEHRSVRGKNFRCAGKPLGGCEKPSVPAKNYGYARNSDVVGD